jgi:hypothetical protein
MFFSIFSHFFPNFVIIFCIYFEKYGNINYMKREKMKFIISLLIAILPLSLCFGGDERSKPVEVFVLFDNSVSMQGVEQDAAAWLSEHVADNILQMGDALTIVSVSDSPAEEFSGTIENQENIAEVKTILSSLTPKNSAGDFRTAFEEVKSNIVSNSPYAHSYIVLVTGMSLQTSFLSSAEAVNYLRYSKSKDFPGWKVMIISLGIEQKAKAAAAAYMRSQG